MKKPDFRTTVRGLLVLASLFVAGSAIAAPAPQDVIEPDRPDLTTGSHLVTAGVVQIEAGVVYTRRTADQQASASPITLRIGVVDWLELRAGFDGLLVATDSGGRETGIGNVQLGAKIRLWSESDGRARLSVNPLVALGTANAYKGLGTGQTDFGIAILFGFDLGRRGRLDMNYGISAIAASDGRFRFVEHLASASASLSAGERWSPYFEMFSISRESPGGNTNVSINTGTLYSIKPRLALDGGVAFGLSDDSPAFAAFGGVSFAVGRMPSRSPQTTRRVTHPTRVATSLSRE